MTHSEMERVLVRIIAQAERMMPATEEEDPQMFELVGGIRVNAEDALGALRQERETAAFNSMFRAGLAAIAAGA